jgi:hypothetical protein
MRPILILFPILVIILSCGSTHNSPFEISPETIIDNKTSLAEIAEDIIYIPIDNSFPIRAINSLRINNDNIYLNIKYIGIAQFDRQGKFVRNIGHMGDGPGEYKGISFTIDDRNKRIYILDQHKIIIYSQVGTFIREFQYVEYILGGAGGIDMLNSFLFISDDILYGNSKFNWILLDTLGNLVSKKENSVPSFKTSLTLRGDIYKFKNKLFYFNHFNDTIFSISADLKDDVAYIFSEDTHLRPSEEFEVKSYSQVDDLFRTGNMFETKHYIFLEYTYQNNSAIFLLNKKTKNTSLAYKSAGITSSKQTRACLINDLDGGMPLSLRPAYYYYVENGSEYIASVINPFDIKSYILSDEFKSTAAKNLEKKKKFEDLANSLKEFDNPVLMIVKLKSKM